MKISTEMASAAKLIGEEKAVEYIAKAGFDAWDFSMFEMCKYDWSIGHCLKNTHPLAMRNYLEFARRLKQIGLDNGIVCNQSHAPFPVYSSEVRSYLRRAIECTAEAGGRLCIIHPDNYKSAQENAEMYLELLPFAKELAEFMKKRIPKHLINEYPIYAQLIAGTGILSEMIKSCMEEGLLCRPENRLGAEGMLMVVEK